jgi:hypothetical protein
MLKKKSFLSEFIFFEFILSPKIEMLLILK